MAVQAQIVVARKTDQAFFVAADDAMADAIARLEEGIVEPGIFHVIDTAAQCAIAGKIVNDAFALGLVGFGQNGLLLGGRRMGRHCPSEDS